MGKRLFVGSLPYKLTEDEMKDFFAQIGEVVSVRIITDRDTGRSKGFGFVEMADDAAGDKAIAELNGKELGGRPITISEAKPQQPR
ncbi:RNA-binding protein [Candidatus Saccharibacteria bacterium RIFCSPHIGHO2_12_FULL_41_12]|nr:MAG: RNA-binding protein [Candidatus Saccharibacteria bacterium RIFCSPHIGHO2_12_FULL_41_12]